MPASFRSLHWHKKKKKEQKRKLTLRVSTGQTDGKQQNVPALSSTLTLWNLRDCIQIPLLLEYVVVNLMRNLLLDRWREFRSYAGVWCWYIPGYTNLICHLMTPVLLISFWKDYGFASNYNLLGKEKQTPIIILFRKADSVVNHRTSITAIDRGTRTLWTLSNRLFESPSHPSVVGVPQPCNGLVQIHREVAQGLHRDWISFPLHAQHFSVEVLLCKKLCHPQKFSDKSIVATVE